MGIVWILGGTSEGRKLAGICAANRIPAVVSVATEYGEQVFSGEPHGQILRGRMDQTQMREYLRTHDIELAIDATHPYAVEVTANIRRACELEAREYIRLIRDGCEDSGQADGAVYVNSVQEAIRYLSGTSGNIMLAAGSKELPAFAEGLDKTRLYPRVLPSQESIGTCLANHIPQANIIAMQGPFSEAVNAALLQQFGCRYLVTKASGSAGGFGDKLSACKKSGVVPVIIRRPVLEDGLDFDAVCGCLAKKYGIPEEKLCLREPTGRQNPPRIDIIGTGMGASGSMTVEAEDLIRRADVLIGGKRMLERYENTGKPLYSCYQAEEIRRIIDGQDGKRIAVLMSGDVGFYSGANKLLGALKGYEACLHPGIPSVAYMAAKLNIPWQDMVLCSVHGRSQNVTAKIRRNEKVFTLAGKGDGIAAICSSLVNCGMDGVEVFVGENLSYASERIWHGSPEDCMKETFGSLCAAVFINHKCQKQIMAPGIPDDMFIRGRVPMTKEEVRAVCLSKLKLTRDAVVYDIGSGTGSVSVEAALAAEDGMVYAIEKKPEALSLTEQNAEKFGVFNLRVVHGTAPDAINGLPSPTHAFIGGSSGNLKEIVAALQEKNPNIRIVISAVSLETISEMAGLAKKCDMELVMVNTAKANQAGSYHLMMGQNPVLIGTIKGGMRWVREDL